MSDAMTWFVTIAENLVTMTQSVGEVSGAIAEQVRGVGEIAAAVNQFDQSTQNMPLHVKR